MMTNSTASGKVSGHRSAFSQTCNLLSKYVKEKKAIGDLSLGMLGNRDELGQNDAFRPSVMNLFPVNKKPAVEEHSKSMDLFPQEACFTDALSELKSSDLTIFYGGQVMVFNDFPAHKAKEMIEIANRGVSQNSSTNSISIVNQTNTNNTTKNAIITDLPIARKASLQRFLEKRKDRIKARAPYNTSKGGEDVASKGEEGNSWLGLTAAPSS